MIFEKNIMKKQSNKNNNFKTIIYIYLGVFLFIMVIFNITLVKNTNKNHNKNTFDKCIAIESRFDDVKRHYLFSIAKKELLLVEKKYISKCLFDINYGKCKYNDYRLFLLNNKREFNCEIYSNNFMCNGMTPAEVERMFSEYNKNNIENEELANARKSFQNIKNNLITMEKYNDKSFGCGYLQYQYEEFGNNYIEEYINNMQSVLDGDFTYLKKISQHRYDKSINNDQGIGYIEYAKNVMGNCYEYTSDKASTGYGYTSAKASIGYEYASNVASDGYEYLKNDGYEYASNVASDGYEYLKKTFW